MIIISLIINYRILPRESALVSISPREPAIENMAKKESKKTSTNPDVEANKNIAALSYIWILCLVPLLSKKNSEFAQFHAKQGLILFIIELIAGLFVWFPFFGQLLMLLLIVISVMGIIKTYNGEWWKIPFIYEWSKKINL